MTVVSFSEEQHALREVVADLRRAHAAHFEAVRHGRATADVWRGALAATGLMGVAIPEHYDGGGGGLVDLVVVAEELGRALDDSLFLATTGLAVPTLLGSDDDSARSRLLPSLASGSSTATVAWAERGGDWAQPVSVETTATRLPGDSDQGWRLDGVKDRVLGGATADILLVVARAADGLGFFEVGLDAPGLTRTPLACLDQTRQLAQVELAGTPARRLEILEGSGGADLLERILLHCAVVLAAEQVGVAAEALDLTVAYAGIREQFGKPIGAFQAVKHRAADMLVRLEVARSTVYYSAFALQQGDPEAWRAVAVAQIVGARACAAITADCIQLHGGIGFTWEHPAHHYFKRARADGVMLGSARDWERRLGDDLVASPLLRRGAS